MWNLIFSDPVVWGSILGIVVMLGMGGFYVYLFVHNTNENL
ncbi:MAG: putative membrane protein [Patiriisocius sp.]|jgi:uncharacterized membrane protein